MTDGCREIRRTLGEAPCFFSIFSMEPARRASSGSYVSPKVKGVLRKPPRYDLLALVFLTRRIRDREASQHRPAITSS